MLPILSFSCKDIKMAVYMHKLREVELLTIGIPFDVDDLKSIQDVLVLMNKTINKDILREWLKRNSKALECPVTPKSGFLHAHELLYLLQNCQDRQEMVKSLQSLSF